MNEEKLAKSTTTDGRPPAPGLEAAAAPQPLGPNGQHGAYWVLTEFERAQGFVRPVRNRYLHVGMSPPANPLRDLTPEEQERYGTYGYVQYEVYPESKAPLTGRFWTAAQLAKINGGCATITTMALALAETYARDPAYYGKTFCCQCGEHLPVGEFRWVEDGELVGS